MLNEGRFSSLLSSSSRQPPVHRQNGYCVPTLKTSGPKPMGRPGGGGQSATAFRRKFDLI